MAERLYEKDKLLIDLEKIDCFDVFIRTTYSKYPIVCCCDGCSTVVLDICWVWKIVLVDQSLIPIKP